MTNIKVNRGLGGLGKGGRRQRHLWSDAGNRLKRREMIHSHRQLFSTSNDKCQFSDRISVSGGRPPPAPSMERWGRENETERLLNRVSLGLAL